jgi:cystathionine beta-synthase
MDILRAVGAKVVVCPTDVEPTDPRSYYSVSKRLAEETPNSWYVNQYDNPSKLRTMSRQDRKFGNKLKVRSPIL